MMAAFADSNYTMVPNDLFDMMATMECSELKVTLAIIRKTRGYHKRADAVSISQLETMTGLGEGACRAGRDAAVERGTITFAGRGKRGVHIYALATPEDSDPPDERGGEASDPPDEKGGTPSMREGVSGGDPPSEKGDKRNKPPKENNQKKKDTGTRKRDPVFDAIAVGLFSMKLDAIDTGSASLVGAIATRARGAYQAVRKSKDNDKAAAAVTAFIKDKGEYAPRNPDKFAATFNTWLQQLPARARTATEQPPSKPVVVRPKAEIFAGIHKEAHHEQEK
jgi:phage replication O-like protein O